MKISIFLVCLSFAQLFAAHSYAQRTKITVDLKNTSIESVLENIENQSDFKFIYNKEKVDVYTKVSIQAKEKAITDILSVLFEGKSVSYTFFGNQVILTKTEVIESQGTQQKPVSGKVSDSQGLPLPGVSVVVKGTTTGTITDMEGGYTLPNVPAAAVLQFSFVGMKNQEITVGNKTTVNITLEEETIGIEEVVAVGYGVQKKVNLTGAVSMIDGKELSKRPVVNITQSLQGTIPGLNASISGSGGTPGKSFALNIRGKGNLSGSDSPYVLVDGVEMNLGDLNPNDIASISVLKDAAAASIYGARAAYGVILISTKSGQEGKMRISYHGTTGWSTAVNLPKMANGYEFAKFFNDGNRNAGVTPQYTEDQLSVLKQYVENPAGINSWPGVAANNSMSTIFENNSRGVGSTDWFKFHYKNFAFKQDHNLSFSGGNKAAQYYVSGGYYDEEGLLKYADIDYRRFNFNASMTSQITKWLTFRVNSKYSLSDSKSPFGTGALNEGMFYHGLARFRATVSPYDLNGNFSELSQVPYLQSGTYTNTDNANSILSGRFEIEPVKQWKIFTEYTYKKTTLDYEALATAAQFVGINGSSYFQNTRSELGIPDAGSFLRSMESSQYQSVNIYSNYNFSLNKVHNFTVMAGYQEETNNYKYLQGKSVGLINSANPGLNLATGDKTLLDTRNGWTTRGYFGRLNYDYDGRYLLEVNGRYDGSSRFMSDNRWGWFPSVSVGWNLAREKFMSPYQHVLNTLKIRTSYGNLGNQSGAGLYTFAQTMNIRPQGNWYFLNGREMLIDSPGTSDPFVTWEKVESKNGGLDFGLFGNRLTGTFEVFERITKDMLGPNQDVADMFGAKTPDTNNAVMRSRGWELSVNYKGKIGSEIDYSVGAMVSDVKSEVTRYSNPTFTDPAGSWYEGKKVGEIWGYRASGIIKTQAEADTYNQTLNASYISGRKFEPGDLKFVNLNGDDKINKGTNVLGDMGDMTIIGNTTPRYLFSANGNISYKGLTLSMLFQGVGKRDYSPAGSNYFSGGGPFAQVTVFREHLNYWREDNPNAYFTKPYISGVGNNGTFNAKTINNPTDYYLQDASYVRLKNLTLSYDLPTVLTSKLNLNKISVFVSGENLFTITNMIDFFDPELVFVSGAGGKNYPLNKVYSVGLTINL